MILHPVNVVVHLIGMPKTSVILHTNLHPPPTSELNKAYLLPNLYLQISH
jgi:hypothetical protein